MEKRKTFSASKSTYQSTQSSVSTLSTTSGGTTWNNSSLEQAPNSELFQQLQELNKDVDTTLEFVCGVTEIICTTIPANVILVMFGCFSIAEISLGIRYLEDCPVESKIPVFLFVGGCFCLLKVIHVLWTNFKMRRHSNYVSESEHSQRAVQIVDGALNVFLLVWQIIGTFWTLSVWYPHSEPPMHEPNNWCDQGLYIFTLIQIGLSVTVLIARICFQVSLAICYKYTDLFEG